jgi:TPR repeat protein
MVRKRRTRIWITTALATGMLLAGCARRAQAADDTARFYGAWISNYAYNGQMAIVESIHDGSGYRNYVRLPFSVTPAGNGSFSAANGRWSAAAAAPDNSGTYTFTDDNTAVCTNSAGQAVTWRRNDGALPAGITPPNYQQLMAAYQQAASTGAAWALTDIGVLSSAGLGAPLDYQQAMSWFQKGAAAGDGTAMNSIGFLYQNGAGVTKDLGQAMAWYQKAAAAGNTLGMDNVGMLYGNGLGVAINYQQAMVWYQKAAAGVSTGSALAMDSIGVLYEHGWGVAENLQQALAWYQKSANAGDAVAMGNVGYYYWKGQGVAINLKAALAWYNAGASAGDPVSQQWMRESAQLLQPQPGGSAPTPDGQGTRK